MLGHIKNDAEERKIDRGKIFENGWSGVFECVRGFGVSDGSIGNSSTLTSGVQNRQVQMVLSK